MATELSIEDRRSRLAEMLGIKGFLPLAECVRQLGVSDSTIRRDLEVLEEQGLIRRTHGGAVYVRDTGPHRLAFADRQTSAAAQKEAIARVVAEMIPTGQTVIINGGTTCFGVARAIQSQNKRLSVITNSVPIASLLATDLAVEVTLIGGYVYPRTGVALGDMAERQLADLHASQMVLSCAGVNPDGAFNANQMMVSVEQAMMRIADKVILAVDSTKFGSRSVVKLCDLGKLDVIVTDSDAPPDVYDWLCSLKTQIVFAEVGK